MSSVSKHIYPHSDSTVGGQFSPISNPNFRQIFENRLDTNLIAGHHYQFGMWVHLCDTLAGFANVGKIAGINSFSAYFSDTVVHWRSNFDITHYSPQVQINQMVTDTGNWVLLRDTFVAEGGERYMCIGNFKTDAQTQWQLVDSINTLPILAYYFYDDVSLIDLDDTSKANGIAALTINHLSLTIYPNPAGQSIVVSCKSLASPSASGRVNTIEITNVVGQKMKVTITTLTSYDLRLDTDDYPSGVYFIKATDANGNVSNAKFVKQ